MTARTLPPLREMTPDAIESEFILDVFEERWTDMARWNAGLRRVAVLRHTTEEAVAREIRQTAAELRRVRDFGAGAA